jgi:hypothetical protein
MRRNLNMYEYIPDNLGEITNQPALLNALKAELEKGEEFHQSPSDHPEYRILTASDDEFETVLCLGPGILAFCITRLGSKDANDNFVLTGILSPKFIGT